jgi:hypothetical protein
MSNGRRTPDAVPIVPGSVVGSLMRVAFALAAVFVEMAR